MNHITKILSNRKIDDTCNMCGVSSYTLWFLWVGMLTGIEVKVCRKCAYKEEFGTKKQAKAKKNNILEKRLGKTNL